MPEDKNIPTKDARSMNEFVRMYYEHQYDRMAKLEEQGMTITNVVVSLSVISLTFGLSNIQGVSAIAGVGLPLIMIFANAFAIFYIYRTSSWIKTHRLRAKRVLKNYAPDLYQLDEATFTPIKKIDKGFGRRKIQIILHILLIISSALIPVIIYWK